MRWKTKDKTYGIEKPAQHFVSWFLRISVSPLCPPPPPPPPLLSALSLLSPLYHTLSFLPSLPSLPSFLFCTLSPPSSPTLPSLPSLPDIYLAYSSNSSTWRTILFPHTYRGFSPTITNLPCYNCYPLAILLSSTHSCFLLPSSTLYCPLSAFPCFFLHFLIVSSLFCISFSISSSCPSTVYSGSFSSPFISLLLFWASQRPHLSSSYPSIFCLFLQE